MTLRNFCYICLASLMSINFMAFVLAAANERIFDPIINTKRALATQEPEGKLVFSHVIFRHGDRTPVNPYPNDPWKNLKDWPVGWGQLTNLGKQQHYELGKWLRKRYNSLLSEKYTKDEIYIRSTDVDRTLMSALAHLSGLYPPENDQIWNENIKWQPIPVHTVPQEFDYVLAANVACPAYDYAYSALQNSPAFVKLREHYAYLFHYLAENTGGKMEKFEDIMHLNNTLFIESLYNKTLPEWTKKVYPSEDMTYITNFAFSEDTYTDQMARLKAGPLIKEILERFEDKIKGKLTPDRSVWIYSGHDTTIANVLNSLKLYDMQSPNYVSTILFEMRLNAQQIPFISIFYKNSAAKPKLLEIPNCGTECPLEKMFELYKNILPKNWKEECKLSTLMMTYEEANLSMAMGILVTIISILLLLSYVIMIYLRRRHYKCYLNYTQVA